MSGGAPSQIASARDREHLSKPARIHELKTPTAPKRTAHVVRPEGATTEIAIVAGVAVKRGKKKTIKPVSGEGGRQDWQLVLLEREWQPTHRSLSALKAWCYAPRKPAFLVAPLPCEVHHKFVLVTSSALGKLHVIWNTE
jgi:hypothetical protein